MGNLALKCENEWQSRKVRVRCDGGALDLRLMRSDGTEAGEFDRAVVAAEIMYRFPEYVVVEWCPMRNTKLEKRGQIRVLKRFDVLSPGQIYFLFPIPTEVVKNNANLNGNGRRSRRTQTSKDRLSLLLKRSEMDPNDASGIQALQRQKSGDVGTSELFVETDWASSKLTSGDAELNSKLLSSFGAAKEVLEESEGLAKLEINTEEPDNPSVRPAFGGRTWRPALISIPESPIGFHSRSESPMTPIAFRLVSLKENESFDSAEPPVLL